MTMKKKFLQTIFYEKKNKKRQKKKRRNNNRKKRWKDNKKLWGKNVKMETFFFLGITQKSTVLFKMQYAYLEIV